MNMEKDTYQKSGTSPKRNLSRSILFSDPND